MSSEIIEQGLMNKTEETYKFYSRGGLYPSLTHDEARELAELEEGLRAEMQDYGSSIIL